MAKLKGIPVVLRVPYQVGEDDLGTAIYEYRAETVENVLVGEPTTEERANALDAWGKRLAYTLAIPKSDTHDWTDAEVEIRGRVFRTFGDITEGIDELIPLSWNRKVKVASYG